MCSDEFGHNRGLWSWVGHEQMNAQIYQCNKCRATVGFNTAGCAVKTRYTNVPHTNVQSTADEHKFR